jgi:hypothetical protein
MNLITAILIKLGILKKDLDYDFVCALMLIIYLFFGYQKWFQYEAQGLIPYISHGPLTFWMYPVFGIRGATLVFRSFRMDLWGTPVLGLLEQESRNARRARFVFFVSIDDYDHSVLPGWLGGFSRRVSSNDRTRCLPHEGSGAFGSFILFAARGRKKSFAPCHRIAAVG